MDFSEMDVFAQELAKLNEKWGYTLATCGEKIDLDKYHVAHNKCIDDDLIIRRAYYDAKLMKFLGVQIVEGGLFGVLITPSTFLTANMLLRRRITKTTDKERSAAA